MTNLNDFIKSCLKKPDNFSHWGDPEMFITWGYLPMGVTTRDDRDCLAESNQAYIVAELEKINTNHVRVERNNHWACGHVNQIAVKLLHNGKPTKAAKRAFEIYQEYLDYPALNESDYHERESEAEASEAEFYAEDFRKEILATFGHQSKPKGVSIKALNSLALDIYRYDCGYCGRENAFVSQESITRFLEQGEVEYHAKTLKKLEFSLINKE